jgi:23S rRNA pseudouridine2605 synthase
VKKEHGTPRTGLARALSKLGYCSRSQAVSLIRAGRVRLNGKPRRDPEQTLRLGTDRIEVDGAVVDASTKVYWMLNKPRGVITTASDEKGRDTVYALLGNDLPWVAPVGRLDKASEGLLLLTNDSDWGARITAPETHLEKTYHVQVGALADGTLTEELVKGVTADSGERLRAKRAGVLRRGEKNTWLTVVLEEGKNRQIRRMLSMLGVEVLRLIRVSIGPLELGDLAKSASRALTASEKAALDAAMLQSERTTSRTLRR